MTAAPTRRLAPACVEKTKPAKVAAAIALRAEGKSLRQIRTATGLAVNTIRRIIGEQSPHAIT